MEQVSQIKHKNIVKFYGHATKGDVVYLMLELCDTSLFDLVETNAISEEQLCRYGLQVLEGLNTLHNNDVIHRDLKADNILIKKGVCKIADFGMGTNQRFFSTVQVGAIGIRAPEFGE